MLYSESFRKGFEQKYRVRGKNLCWEWRGGTVGNGYGRVFVDGKPLLAHRVSWELRNGEVPEGMIICHHCDNPSCVNPSHLFVGTHRDNMMDMAKKGRAIGGLYDWLTNTIQWYDDLEHGIF